MSSTFADFNGDGILDAVSERSILPGRGDGTFGTEILIDDRIPDPRFASQKATDLDDDGLPDLLLASARGDVGNGCGAGWLGTGAYLSAGFAGFTPAGAADMASAAGWPTDWDGDGHVDLVGGTWVGSNCAIALVRGDGTGHFGRASVLAPRELEIDRSTFVVTDLDGDGRGDLAARLGGDAGKTRIVLFRHSEGSLLEPVSGFDVPTPFGLRGNLATADVDNDGRPDILRWASNSLIAAPNRGGWVFETFERTFGMAGISDATFADFDGDGFLYAALILQESTGTSNVWRVEIFSGDGAGGFAPTSTIPLGSGNFPWLAAGDFDNDGRTDLWVRRGQSGFDVFLNTCADGERLAVVVPSVASAPGRFGAYFRTRLELKNPGSEAVRGRLVYHPRSRPGSESDPSLPFALDPGATLTYQDVLAELVETGSGSLDVVVTAGGAPLVRAEVYNDTPGMAPGSAVEDGIPPANFLRLGNFGAFALPADLSGKRVAVGLRTFTEGATLRVTVRDAGGNVRHVVHRPFGPSRSLQLPADQFLFGYVPGGGETITVSVMAGGALLYGTVTDNATNTPSIQVLSRN